jgi:NAD-dependent SIR2 family protein deacetylase
MKKTGIITSIFFVYSLHANILLEKPRELSAEEIEELANQWHTTFTWSWSYKGWAKLACSFIYENSKAGFALQCFGIPFYSKRYRVIPTIEELQQYFHSSNYFFNQPLEYHNTHPRRINKEEFFALIAQKQCIFYTGAGISAMSGIATMGLLEESLAMDKGIAHFLKEAWSNPQRLCNAFADFCRKAISGNPTTAHYTLKRIALEKAVAIITENVDLLQHRTGIEPIFSASDKIAFLSPKDWQKVDAIICIGISHDDRGLLGKYRKSNPDGILIAIDLQIPTYLADFDYICLGDLQEILS